ncbi:MAG: hypothetical protein R3C26_05705 [Calditrichia bacterium]
MKKLYENIPENTWAVISSIFVCVLLSLMALQSYLSESEKIELTAAGGIGLCADTACVLSIKT